MITKEVLEAQREQYQKGKAQAMIAFNKAQSDLYMFDGAIEACNALLALEADLEKEK